MHATSPLRRDANAIKLAKKVPLLNRHPKEFVENWVDHLANEFLHAEKRYERALDRGAPRERAIRAVLAGFLPKKYGITAGHVVSSAPAWSRQSDVIIYDSLATPVFSSDDEFQGTVLPAEGVYGIVEVKSTLDADTFRDAAEKIAEFKRLCSQVNSPRLYDRFGAIIAFRSKGETTSNGKPASRHVSVSRANTRRRNVLTTFLSSASTLLTLRTVRTPRSFLMADQMLRRNTSPSAVVEQISKSSYFT